MADVSSIGMPLSSYLLFFCEKGTLTLVIGYVFQPFCASYDVSPVYFTYTIVTLSNTVLAIQSAMRDISNVSNVLNIYPKTQRQ